MIGAVLASRIAPTAYADTYIAAARPAWWIIAGCGLTALVIGQLTNTRRTRQERRDDERATRTVQSTDSRRTAGTPAR
ncbi:hypothetical protein [Streptomyces sp. RTd22]|uniref:hypothetical protein n=1 Tax=Streptomyces sp. RTd22 TaxID=1841249 RepID=UPI0007C5BA85